MPSSRPEIDSLDSTLSGFFGERSPDSEKLYFAGIDLKRSELAQLGVALAALKALVGEFSPKNEQFYLAAIRNPLGFLAILNTLKALVGEFSPKNEAFYLTAILQTRYANRLARALGELKNLIGEFSPEENEELYLVATRQAEDVEDLIPALKALKKLIGELESENEAIYLEVISNVWCAEKLTSVFEMLNQSVGETSIGIRGFYRKVIRGEIPLDAAEMSQTFETLKKFIGVLSAENEAIYLEVISRGWHAKNLTFAFEALHQSIGKMPIENRELYLEVIRCGERFDHDQMSQAFETLKDFIGEFSTEYQEFYRAVIYLERSNLNQLKVALEALTALVGEFSSARKALYLAVISNPLDFLTTLKILKDLVGELTPKNKRFYLTFILQAKYVDKLIPALERLKNLIGELCPENEVLYLIIIPHAKYVDKLTLALEALNNIVGEFSQKNEELYFAIIRRGIDAPHVPKALGALKNLIGELSSENEALYLAVIRKGIHAPNVPRALEALKNLIGEPSLENKELYLSTIARVDNTGSLVLVFKILKAIGFDLNKNKYFDVILNATDHILLIFQGLKQAGYDYATYSIVYDFFLKQIEEHGDLTSLDIKCLQRLCKYAQNATLTVFRSKENIEKYLADIKEIIEEIIKESKTINLIDEGPLNKSISTYKVTKLLDDIANAPIENILFFYDEIEGYIIQLLPDSLKINLTLLLKDANLSHLTLSQELIERLGEKMDAITQDGKFNQTESALLNALPQASQRAIQYYTAEKYQNINRLFRGVAPDKSTNYVWLQPYDMYEKQNLLIYFICGALVNDAANKLQVLASTDERFQSFLPTHPILSRKESLSQEIINRRRAAPYQVTPSITSFSASDDGFMSGSSNVVTKMDAANLRYPIVNPTETEILIPHGETLVYAPRGNTTFFASIVRSPSLEQAGRYFSHQALLYAFKHHLKNSYSAGEDAISIADKTIQRPNHGLAHTFRVMKNIDNLVSYFAHHAEEEAFRSFCQTISEEGLECLRIAAAFSVTGRESEISAKNDLPLYKQYRESSEQYFRAFLEKNQPTVFCKEGMVEKFAHLVRYMGDPNYETLAEKFKEKDHQCYLHRILNIAHKLDLVRCYNPTEFKVALAPCVSLSRESDAQHFDFQQIIRYNIQLIKAHGSALETNITANGELLACSLPYAAPFEEVSLSLKRLFEVSDTVPRLNFTEYSTGLCRK